MLNFTEHFSVRDTRGKFILEFKGETLVSINKNQLTLLCKEFLGIGLEMSDIDKKALILATDYNKLKSLYYNGRTRTVKYTIQHKGFKHFVAAYRNIVQLETDNATYLKAQIAGLQYVNQTGIFPTPGHLASEEGYNRAVEYLAQHGKINTTEFHDNDLTKINGKITLNKHDIETPLTQNTKYMNLLSKLRSGKANIDEARYLKACRKKRKGNVGLEIQTYISKLKGEKDK